MITEDLAPWGLHHRSEVPGQAITASRHLIIEWITQL